MKNVIKSILLSIITKALFILIAIVLIISKSYADHGKKLKIDTSKGPWVHKLYSKNSSSNKFTRKGVLLVDGGHVPSLVEKNGILYAYFQWFPKNPSQIDAFDHIGFKTKKLSENKWSETEKVVFKNVPKRVFGKKTRPMDPSAVLLQNNTIRLYFTLEPFGPMEKIKGDARIFSAVSTDGKVFIFEEGARLSIDNLDLRDPAISYFKNKWHLYIPNQKRNGTGIYAISKDGLNFTRQKDVRVSAKGDWLGHSTVCKNKLYFFGTVWKGLSNNGQNWKSFNSLGVGPDPAVICLSNGKWSAITSVK
ncbi:MAG: hypothetical protein CFH01_00350 [Alphaproteobacteria bacterium MarineAlpha2_Bin1]|nr:MAG: hypothetical protein CFH01_00350 [Alphaproteobacteria bacterium MarineAlpha2_Bin1]|tara:strand:+ start:4056 stop:4973 length:918 start_codon:yes stop_codon:yes gene_type:complete